MNKRNPKETEDKEGRPVVEQDPAKNTKGSKKGKKSKKTSQNKDEQPEETEETKEDSKTKETTIEINIDSDGKVQGVKKDDGKPAQNNPVKVQDN